MDPTGPSQPTLNQSYNTAGNPVDQTPQETSSAAKNAQSNSASIVDQREKGDLPVPSTHGQEATPSSLGYGARDASGDAGETVRPFPNITAPLELTRSLLRVFIPETDIQNADGRGSLQHRG